MTPLLAAMAWALASAGHVVEVAFLPDNPELPPLVVRIEQHGAARSVAWVIAAEQSASGVLADRKGAERSLLALPQPPPGASLHDDGAVLVLTIDDAGDWARRYRAPPAGASRARVAGVSVAGERALRLVAPALGAPPGPASLVGAETRVAGRGVSLSPISAEARALVRTGAELELLTPTPVDGTNACGGVVASAWSSDRPALRLLAVGSPVCAGAIAVIKVAGVRVGPRQDLPVTGVVTGSLDVNARSNR